MRKIKFVAVLALLIGFAFSCEVREPCEINQVGDITIRNETGFWFYFALDDYNEFKLYDGDSKTYYDERAGTHDFYYYDDLIYEQWIWGGSKHLNACDHLTFTWVLNKKKSTERELYIEVTNERGDVIQTITGFKPINR